MTSVLVGIDGSENSKVALAWAATLAQALGLPLRTLWAWQYPADTVVSVGEVVLDEPARVDELVGAQLRALVTDVLGQPSGKVTAQVARGPAAAALLRSAQASPAMIVVGSRGLGGFKGLLLGSVSRQLAEHAPSPVTIVPPAASTRPRRLEHLMVAVDGSTGANRALTFGAELASKANAELVAAHALAPHPEVGVDLSPPPTDPLPSLAAGRELLEDWCAPLRDAGVAYRTAVVRGDARTALLEAARDRGADLLIVGSRGRGAVTKLLLGSVAASLIRHSDRPVTVVPHQR